ncbi:MAG: hemolysin family protein [Candidatus Kariarchaeaceae archaeon]|jgi:CBS domain containing-hemolysin-like protein
MVSLSILVFIIILIIINGLFVVAEFSLLRVPKTRIEKLIESSEFGSKKLEIISNNLNVYITSLQIGITMTTLALGVLGEPFFTDIFKSLFETLELNLSNNRLRILSFIFGFFTIVSLHTIFGEIGPRTITIQRIERMALISAVPAYWITKLISPFSNLFRRSAIIFLKILRVPTVQEVYKEVYSEDELKLIIAQSKEEGEIDATEQMMINRIFDFTDTTVREIITPRYEIIAFPVDTDVDEIIHQAKTTGFSRFPIYEEKLDQIIGFIHIKDVILTHNEPDFSLRSILREAIIIHEGMRLDTLLKKMQIKRSQVALAIDEYGSVEGLVTIEDLLEEIVGEIDDEFDEESISLIKRAKDKSYAVDGRITLDHFNAALNVSLEAEDSVTLAGFILEHLDALPTENSTFFVGDCEFTVIKMDGNRIEEVQVHKLTEEQIKEKIGESTPKLEVQSDEED